jgi:hypothetical protein
MNTYDTMNAQTIAVSLCHSPRFQQFVGARTIKSGVHVDAPGCERYIRDLCQIYKLTDLSEGGAAAECFQQILTAFYAWCRKRCDQVTTDCAIGCNG